MTADQFVTVGRIVAAYGIKGWVKVQSHTDPISNILDYAPWYVMRHGQWVTMQLEAGREHGTAVVAKIEGCDDRNAAEALAHSDVAVKREQLPAPAPGEYYWIDLVGLRVVNRQDIELGVVKELFATGANDVLVVKGDKERLIPYVKDVVVLDVDLAAGVMRVDWEPDY